MGAIGRAISRGLGAAADTATPFILEDQRNKALEARDKRLNTFRAEQNKLDREQEQSNANRTYKTDLKRYDLQKSQSDKAKALLDKQIEAEVFNVAQADAGKEILDKWLVETDPEQKKLYSRQLKDLFMKAEEKRYTPVSQGSYMNEMGERITPPSKILDTILGTVSGGIGGGPGSDTTTIKPGGESQDSGSGGEPAFPTPWKESTQTPTAKAPKNVTIGANPVTGGTQTPRQGIINEGITNPNATVEPKSRLMSVKSGGNTIEGYNRPEITYTKKFNKKLKKVWDSFSRLTTRNVEKFTPSLNEIDRKKAEDRINEAVVMIKKLMEEGNTLPRKDSDNAIKVIKAAIDSGELTSKQVAALEAWLADK